MIVRPLKATDLAALEAIQSACPEAAQWPVPDYLGALCLVAVSTRDSAQKFTQETEPPPVLGFVAARQTVPGEAEILNLAVDPALRRQGIGRALLSALLAGLSGEVFLEVRASNAAALRLYESLGFLPVGRRHSYYSHPREDAIVLRFQAC